MEPKFRTSFIPKQPIITTPAASARRGPGLLFLVSLIVFLSAAILAGAVFLYQQYLTTEGKSKVEQLKRAKDAFDPPTIQKFTRLDDRMHAADRVLSSHIAPSVFFLALEQATLQTVSFGSLDFQVPDPQHLSVKMAGVAQSVNSIALQADIFSKNGVITNPIFSNITRQSDGVHFDLTAIVNPAAINYAAYAGAAPVPQADSLNPPASTAPLDGLKNNQQPPVASSTPPAAKQPATKQPAPPPPSSPPPQD